MKKIYVVMCIVLTIAMLVSCTPVAPESTPEQLAEQPSTTPTAGMPNPIVEVSSADEISQQLGMDFKIPAEATDAKFAVIDGKIGQAGYTYMDTAVLHRQAFTDGNENLTGVSEEQVIIEQRETFVGGQPFPFTAKVYDGFVIGVFYDEQTGVQYSIDVETDAFSEVLSHLVAEIAPVPVEEMPGVANPMVEVESAIELQAQTGLFLPVPTGVEAKYFVIDGRIAQADFIYNDVNASYRAAKTDGTEDISGLSGDLEVTEELETMINEHPFPFTAQYNEGGIGVASWYMESEDSQYSLFVESNADAELLKELVAIIAPVG